MNIRRFYMARTIGFVVLVAVVGVFFLFNKYIYHAKQRDNTQPQPYRATLEGVYVCLPDKDTNQAKTLEQACEPGIKTSTDEYYSVNFFLMSQTHTPPKVGQLFSANGVISTNPSSDPNKWQQYDFTGEFSVTDSLTLLDEADEDTSQVTTSLGNQVTALDLVSITPKEIISDSRCPATVECVWAGTVEVLTTLSTQVSHGEHVLTVGKPQTFGDYTVTLTDVSPDKTEKTIPNYSYKFTYLTSSKLP